MMRGWTAIMTRANRHAMTRPMVHAMVTAETERQHRQPHEDERVGPRLRLDLAVVRQKIDGYHAPHGVRVDRLHSAEHDCAEAPQDRLLPLRRIHHQQPPERWHRQRPQLRVIAVAVVLAGRARRAGPAGGREPPAHAVAAAAQLGGRTSRRRQHALLSGVFRLLQADERGVEGAVVGDELVVGAELADLAGLHDRDHVGVAHGGEAVRDHNGGPADGGRVERVLHDALRLRVQRAGGLVEQEDLGGLENGPRYRYSLLLSPRHLHSPFSNLHAYIFTPKKNFDD
ncbi:hypothetical protein ACMD2_09055 [Ananas comosus]|uniref:Uncharacterized protein n=1 Tax=Ananas comosus TaxID=4615 RepID=A0A199VL78_ANACO|nr:hypothetical protein ACMD2_09055 [Ananas comosus]